MYDLLEPLDKVQITLNCGPVILLTRTAQYLTIRPAAPKGYGSIAHEAKPNGLLIRGL